MYVFEPRKKSGDTNVKKFYQKENYNMKNCVQSVFFLKRHFSKRFFLDLCKYMRYTNSDYWLKNVPEV